jgi:hypothetical protein
MAKPIALMDLMKRSTSSAASKIFHSTMTKNAAAKPANGNVNLVTVSPLLTDVMAKLNAQMDLMKVMTHAASKNTPSTTIKDVDVRNPNGPVPTETASTSKNTVMVKPNVLMDLMKVTKPVASRSSHSMTKRNVAATQNPNSPAPTVNASQKAISVTEKPNVPMDLMKVTNSVASRNTLSTTTNNVVVSPTNGNATTENASTKPIDVMVKPITAVINQICAWTNAASKDSASSTLGDAVAIQRVSGDVLTVTASLPPICAMVKSNA